MLFSYSGRLLVWSVSSMRRMNFSPKMAGKNQIEESDVGGPHVGIAGGGRGNADSNSHRTWASIVPPRRISLKGMLNRARRSER